MLADRPYLAAGQGAGGPEFVRTIGAVAPTGKLNDPLGVAVSQGDDERIFVVDHGNARIQVFSPQGASIGEWGRRGHGPGQFWDPTDIALSPDGRYAYVVDRGHREIKRFRPDPSCFESGGRDCFTGSNVKVWGHRGSGDGLFETPTGIAVDRSGHVYVTDWAANNVQVFDSEGAFIRQMGEPGEGPGELMRPADLDIAPDGRVWVADRDNNRLAIFEPDGSYQGAWNAGGQLYRPTGIAVHSDGSFIIRDYEPSYRLPRVWRYSGDRHLLDGPRMLGGDGTVVDFPLQGAALYRDGVAALADAFGPVYELWQLPQQGEMLPLAFRGKELSQVDSPAAVAVDDQFFVVSDAGNRRVLLLDPEDGDRTVAVMGVFGDFDLREPGGVAVHRFGSGYDQAVIYIASPVNHTVYLASPSGTKLGQWGDGTPGSGEEGLHGPRAVTVGPDGDVFVADTMNHRIVRRSAYPEGAVLGTIGGPGDGDGEFYYPMAVTVGPGGLVYVLEQGLHRLQAFNADGTHVATWAELFPRPLDGVEPGYLWFPVALGSDGENLYVVEDDARDHTRVQVLRPQPGVPLAASVVAVFAAVPGPGPGEAWRPRGVAASPDGLVLLSDSGNNRLQLFAWPGHEPPPTPVQPTATPLPTATPPPTATTSPTEPATRTTDVPTAEPTSTFTPDPTATPRKVDTPAPNLQPTPPWRAFLPVALRK